MLMKLKIKWMLVLSLTSIFCFAQPINDECVNAIDISEAFSGSCGVSNLIGPYSVIDATTTDLDPLEPSRYCDQEVDGAFFNDESIIFDNSIWFSFTVPDFHGDGSDVSYSLYTSVGIVFGDCGLDNPLPTGDTQLVIYADGICQIEAADSCAFIYGSEDVLGEEPWVSGFEEISFSPNETYYILIDTWNGEQGEFCFDITPCGLNCGDNICTVSESYCDCQADCQCDQMILAYYNADGYLETNCDNEVFFNGDWMQENFNYGETDNLYISFGILGANDCINNSVEGATISYNNGTLLLANNDFEILNNGDYLEELNQTFIEFTPQQIEAGQVNITASSPNGLGGNCSQVLNVIFEECDSYWAAIGVEPVGIDKYQTQILQIYPNPNQGEFYINDRTSYMNNQIEVFDFKGQSITTQIQQEKIIINNASTGIYFLKVKNELLKFLVK